MKFKVSVEKRMYSTGFVIVDAVDDENENPAASQAIAKVSQQIIDGKIKMSDINWGETIYEDGTFDVTGDVDDNL